MAAPAMVELIRQVTPGDCAICCVAMWTTKAYREVSDVATRLWERPHHTGLGTRQIKQLARRLGCRLISKRPVDLEGQSGILLVKHASGEHAVLVFGGSVYDPASGLLSDFDTYLADQNARPLAFLVS